jgi:hypothetical protein
VLARAYIGLLVPAETGRRTYVGTCVWSEPRCAGRVRTAVKLFDGLLSPADAQAFVSSTGARFLLRDCRSHGNLPPLLGPMLRSEKRFGCASVYEVG